MARPVVRKPRAKKAQTRKPKPDGLKTTPTQVGTRSPDYKKRAGDPRHLRQYSEEQIGMMGGRKRIAEVIAKKPMGVARTSTTGKSRTGLAAPWENYGSLPGTSVLGADVEKEAGGGGGRKKKPKRKGKAKPKPQGRSRAGKAQSKSGRARKY